MKLYNIDAEGICPCCIRRTLTGKGKALRCYLCGWTPTKKAGTP